MGWTVETFEATGDALLPSDWIDDPTVGRVQIVHPQLQGFEVFVEFHESGELSSTELFDMTTRYRLAITGWHGWSGLLELAVIARRLLDRYGDNLLKRES